MNVGRISGMYYFYIDGVRGFTNDVATWAKMQAIELDEMRGMLYEANPELATRRDSSSENISQNV